MPIGIVKWFNITKGYGYIIDDQGTEVFFHYSEILDQTGFKSLHKGDRVQFSMKNDTMGPRATDVRRLPAKPDSNTRSSGHVA